MTYEPENHVRSVIVGDLKLPPEGTAGAEAAEINPDEKVPMLIELNLRYPGGLAAVRQGFYQLWADYVDRAGGSWPAEPASADPVQPRRPAAARAGRAQALPVRPVPGRCAGDGRARPPVRPRGRAPSGHLPGLAGLHVGAADRPFGADREGRRGLALLRRPWPRYRLGRHRQRDRRLPSALFRAGAGRGGPRRRAAAGPDQPAAPRFQLPGQPGRPAGRAGRSRRSGRHPGQALSDESGHGTHVAGIIAGLLPDGSQSRWSRSPKKRWTAGMFSGHASAGCPAWRRRVSW